MTPEEEKIFKELVAAAKVLCDLGNNTFVTRSKKNWQRLKDAIKEAESLPLASPQKNKK